MSDDQTLALEASEVVPTEVEQTEAPEAVESTEGQDETQPAEVDAEAKAEAEAEEKKSKSAERRERRKQELERLRSSESEARARAEEAQRQLQAAQHAAKSLPKPKQADFQDFDEYQAALSAFQVANVIDSREVQRLEASAKAHFDQVDEIKQQQRQEDAQNWAAQVEEGREKYPDFEAVALSENIPINQAMAEMIVSSDVAADVTYFLGKNPELSRQISGFDQISMARAIGKIEAQVSAPKPKTTSTAPEPINPIKGKATAAKDPAKMSMAEYEAARKSGKL